MSDLPLLLQPAELLAVLEKGDVLVFDCRGDLKDREAGRRAWLAGHVPGARYADLDRDLAAPVRPDSGRHPLPTAEVFADFLARSGWTPQQRVVAYDAQGGAFAVRLWWLMRHFGFDASLLDGGWPAWQVAGLPVEIGETPVTPTQPVSLKGRADDHVGVEALQVLLEEGDALLLDARDAARFAGEVEPIDPVPGHVPGARNRPFNANLDPQGRFRPAAELAETYHAVLGDYRPDEIVHMCGSGVTACHNLFAMELAGLRGSKLYPGSWSEWIRDPQRPVARGSD